MCVKCGGSHNSEECKKSKETPAKCASCGGNHPANYKGCENYHKLTKGNNTFRNNTQRTPPANICNIYRNNIQYSGNSRQPRSYAGAIKSSTNQIEDTATKVTKFVDEFEGLFIQLLEQNSLILNMLTVLISKISF